MSHDGCHEVAWKGQAFSYLMHHPGFHKTENYGSHKADGEAAGACRDLHGPHAHVWHARDADKHAASWAITRTPVPAHHAHWCCASLLLPPGGHGSAHDSASGGGSDVANRVRRRRISNQAERAGWLCG